MERLLIIPGPIISLLELGKGEVILSNELTIMFDGDMQLVNRANVALV